MSSRLNIDEARLLPRYRQPGTNTSGSSNAHGSSQTSGTSTYASSIDTARASGAIMVDPRDLRGVPITARGVGGVSPHTQPEAEAIYRITRREQAA